MVSFTDYYNVISIYRLPSKTKTEMIQGTLTILFYVSSSSHQLQRICRNFAKFTRKKSTTLQQVTGVNTLNLGLKRMLGNFLKTPPLKKILEFQD